MHPRRQASWGFIWKHTVECFGPFSSAQKLHFGCRNKKEQRQISHANIPPKWGITCLFYAFCSFGWVLKPIFKNRTFSYQSIFLPKEKKQKMETIFNANIHPKWWITFLFFAFTTLGRVLCQFLKIAFKFRLLWSHCLGYTAKKVIWSDDHMSALFLRSAINSFCSC